MWVLALHQANIILTDNFLFQDSVLVGELRLLFVPFFAHPKNCTVRNQGGVGERRGPLWHIVGLAGVKVSLRRNYFWQQEKSFSD